MKYISKQNSDEAITVAEAKKDTIIDHSEYGKILVTTGNYILTRSNGPKKGEKVGITKADLELQYKPADK